MLSAYFLDKRLDYIVTFSDSVYFSVVNLVMLEQYSAITCARLERSTEISMSLFVTPLLLYPPWWEVC